MQEISEERDALLSRISTIVDKLIQSKNLFQRLNRSEMIKLLLTLVKENLSTEQLRAIDDDELTHRIKTVMVIEAVAGTLNDLTPEQMEIFDAAVEGR